jgi:hypothetical protein
VPYLTTRLTAFFTIGIITRKLPAASKKKKNQVRKKRLKKSSGNPNTYSSKVKARTKVNPMIRSTFRDKEKCSKRLFIILVAVKIQKLLKITA